MKRFSEPLTTLPTVRRSVARLLLWSLTLVSLFVSTAGHTQQGAAPVAEVPKRVINTFTYKPLAGSDIPLVTVRINNSFDATFVVDTGCNACLISDALVKKMGLATQPAVLDTASNEPVTLDGKPVSMTIVKPFQVGTMAIGQVPILVTEESAWRSLAGPSVDGILGANVLLHFTALFDFPHRSITLWYPGGMTPEEIAAQGFRASEGVTLRAENDTDFYVSVILGNGKSSIKTDLRLDTGSYITQIADTTAQALKLMPDRPSHTIHQLTQSFAVDYSVVPSLSVAGVTLRDHSVTYLHGKVLHERPILGLDVLGGYRVLVDFPNLKMYIAPPADPLVQIKPAAPPSPAPSVTPPAAPANVPPSPKQP